MSHVFFHVVVLPTQVRGAGAEVRPRGSEIFRQMRRVRGLDCSNGEPVRCGLVAGGPDVRSLVADNP